VLLGVDTGEHGRAAVEHAFEMAALFGAPLLAVHASANEPADAALAESLRPAARRHPGVLVERIVEQGDPVTALLRWAAGARLVVVGSRGRNRTLAVLLGSTSQDLLHHVTVPLMICRDHGSW
jgi:nucleotide-binding universal stress UspA family protein